MQNPLLERILRESGSPELFAILAERLTPTDLQSLLLEVYRARAAQRTPAALLAEYERNRFVRPSPISPRVLLEFDRLAYRLAAPLFDPIELAPVTPLGTNAAVAAVDQNSTIATIRNTELVSDSTNVLALECAVRRRAMLRARERVGEAVRLCASHRLLRPQPHTGPAWFSHFRLFSLCTAGRDQGAFRFEIAALLDQLRFYLRLLSAAAEAGYGLRGLRLGVTDWSGMQRERLETGVIAPLRAEFPAAQIGFDPDRTQGRDYYQGVCFLIYAADDAGTEYALADGGFTSWTQQLLSNNKERLLISGIGTERVCSVFYRGDPPAANSEQ